MPPRASRPVGIALRDKPAGPSSFALVAEQRRRTRARTGHAGTLDPFATGLLLLLSGAATRLAPCFVGLDKRYLTEIDLTATTSTGDPEGEVLERHPGPSLGQLEQRLDALRGEIALPIPAASAVKIDGERAYKLARQGIAVEMPIRRSLVHELELVETVGPSEAIGSVRIALHVSSGTYIRAIAGALGGHCLTLRRTAIGPFRIEEASVEGLLPAAAALERLAPEALSRVPESIRAAVLAVEAQAPAPAEVPA